ncbi:hypothetical protein ASG82_18680 [Mycobacterium sp. Soil538]|nr:hypothetical protein ASG82_18680 [Mycobacterium sp. Soil538]
MGDSSISVGLEILPRDIAGNTPTVELVVTGSTRLEIPGLRLAVDQVGAGIPVVLDSAGGWHLRLGELQIYPPAGAMASLELPAFSGGGYLEHLDSDVWRGAVTARVGPVAVNGLLIISGGDDGFSLLVLLAAEFTPPIQLSFGFTLVGVGGMVGINRGPNVEALTAAAGSGDLSRLLFPQDAVADAPRLLPVLDNCFPASPGDFIVGPMLKLGWGTPTFVSATIGVLVSSTAVVVVGRAAITLPFEQAALIRLEGLLLGIITPSLVILQATLANSHIVGIPIDGEIRFLSRSGPGAVVAFSAGGFHPDFTPPEHMTGMKRIGTEISPGPILRARLGAYLAVTTNTVQFGAEAELVVGFDEFNINGHFKFDALFVFDPFAFQADISARVAIEVAGFDVGSVGMRGHLSGPAPYRISGHAEVSLGLDDIDVDLPTLTWGASSAQPLPPARDPVGVLTDQIRTVANWAPGDHPTLLSRLHPQFGTHVIAVHPMGQVSFRQHAVPLNIPLQRMDGVPLAEPMTVGITAKDVPSDQLHWQPREFVPSQFFTYDRQKALSSAGFVGCAGGFDYKPEDAVVADDVQPREPIPEVSVLGDGQPFWRLITATLPEDVFRLRRDLVPKELPPRVVLRDPGLATIASVRDLTDHTADVTAAAGIADLPAHIGMAAGLLERLDVEGLAVSNLQSVPAWELS